MKYISENETDTAKIAKEFAKTLVPPVTVAFTGGLGAGKTTFIRFLCRELGYDGPVTSPTFAIMNEYRGRTPIYHYDAYRLNGGAELHDVGYREFRENGVSLIEWSENVDEGLEGKVIYVDIDISGEKRIILISEEETL